MRTLSPEKTFQNAVKDALTKFDGTIDQVICRKNGNVEVKKSYYYTFDDSATKYADRIREVMEREGLGASVRGEDRWAAWPKTSYFVAIISPVIEPKEGN